VRPVPKRRNLERVVARLLLEDEAETLGVDEPEGVPELGGGAVICKFVGGDAERLDGRGCRGPRRAGHPVDGDEFDALRVSVLGLVLRSELESVPLRACTLGGHDSELCVEVTVAVVGWVSG